MEKILLEFNERDYKLAMAQLRTGQSHMQGIVDGINAIGSFQMNQFCFQNVLDSNGEYVAKQIEKATREELERAKISSGSIVTAAVKGDLEKYYTILKTRVRPVNAQSLSLNEEGKVVISEEAEKDLREQFSHYITTEKGLELYAAHKKAIKAINEFMALVPQLGSRDFGQIIGVHFGQNQFGINSLDYDRLTANG